MSAQALNKTSHDSTRLGEHAAKQPLSGKVNEMTVVSGVGRGGFFRMEKTSDDQAVKKAS